MAQAKSKQALRKRRQPYLERIYRRRERVHTRVLKKLDNGVTVWAVEGRYVRSAFAVGWE